MEALKAALLLVAVLVPLFLILNYFGLLVVRSGTFFGGAAGSLTSFRGQYRSLCGYVSKNFWIASKYNTMSIQVEPVSGSADVEIRDAKGLVLYAWKACLPLEREINCRELRRCKVRIASRDFAGKFLISLQNK